MAIPEKRTLGSWMKWLGVIIIASLGIVIIPTDKLLRARATITQVLESGCEFHVYRSLMGLLEHFRAVNLQGRNVMHGLYQPHGSEGASREGPSGWVHCDELMRKQLQRWLTLTLRSAGVSVKRALQREQLEPLPSLTVVMDSDACHGDASVSGIGGYCHSFYYYFPVPSEDEDIVHTPLLELLGNIFNVATFDTLVTTQHTTAEVRVRQRMDALTSALTLPAASQNSPVLVMAYQRMTELPQWTRMAKVLQIEHLFGDCNVVSDRISRAEWHDFRQLCRQLAVKPVQLPVPDEAVSIYTACVQLLRRAKLPQPMGASPIKSDDADQGTSKNAVDLASFVCGGVSIDGGNTRRSPLESARVHDGTMRQTRSLCA